MIHTSPQEVSQERYARFLAILPAVCAGTAILVGASVLIGWGTDNETLKRVIPGLVAMNPLTAALFICSGLALALFTRTFGRSRERPARVLGAFVGVIALIKLADLLSGWLPDFDRMLFSGKLDDVRDRFPNSMAPNTTLNFILIGAALVWANRPVKRFSLSQALAILAGFGALLPITGYAYGASSFEGHPAFIPMALHTAILFFILSIGVFFASPSAPLTQIFLSNEPSGILARRLFPLAVLLTLFLGWLRLWGDRRELYDRAFGAALFSIALCVLLALLVRWAIWTISRLEEERAAANRRLQELNRRKDEMIAVVSHDLCSPLTGFRMVIDLLREDPARASGDLLNIMDQSARRMVSMVRGLLDVAKLQSHEVALEFSDVLVSDVVRESMEPLAINANAKHITMHVDASPHEPVIRADRLCLSQIFNNLLSNAVKFTSAGGEVTVCIEPDRDTVRVIVKDTGLGIPPNELPHVFDKYYQAATKSTAGEPGTGLGLAIVRELVLLHGGRIDVESTIDHGTIFTVCLPTEPTNPPAPPE